MDAADSDAGSTFDHAAWRTGLGTLAGYALILLVMSAVLFLVPYAVFATLG
jgi:hypothetical protein